jgi:Mn-dependent DtxR family transcriptional regulator
MLYRQVYALIDGRRKVSDIAHMLHKSQREVAQIIENLRQRDLIAFD